MAGNHSLTNRLLFAMADTDGIKCDIKGNVYSGYWDEINIWSSRGVVIGKIKIPRAVESIVLKQSKSKGTSNDTPSSHL